MTDDAAPAELEDDVSERERSVTMMFTVRVFGTEAQAIETVERVRRYLEVELHRDVLLDEWKLF